MRILGVAADDLSVNKGTSLRAHHYFDALARLGETVCVAALAERASGGSYETRRLPKHTRLHTQILAHARTLRGHALDFKPDCVFAVNHWAALSAWLAFRGGRLPLVIDVHGPIAEDLFSRDGRLPLRSRPKRSAYNIFERWLFASATGLTVVCPNLKDLFARVNPNILVLPGGADTTKFCPAVRPDPNLRAWKRSRVLVLYAGTDVPYQGLPLLLEAAAKLLGSTDRFAFALLGPVSPPRDMDHHFRRGVRFLGAVPYAQVPRYLAAADVLVLPRIPCPLNTYAFPSKLPEYLSSGRAVVVTRSGAHTDWIVHGSNGLICEPTAESLASALLSLRQASRRERLGQEARKTALSQFQWPHLASTLSGFLETVTHPSPPPGLLSLK